MRRARSFVAGAALLALLLSVQAGCANKQPAGEAEEAGGALEQSDPNLEAVLEDTKQPGEQAAEPEKKLKPKVASRDRDPEEERRKMAESRKISANARQAQKVGNSVRATTLAREALRVHEQNAEAMIVLAEVFYGQGMYELALSVTSSVLQIDERVRTARDTSMAHNIKGYAYLRMNKGTLATRSFRKAAETDAKNATAWNNLGAQYLRTGNIKSAIDCFAYATRLDTRFAKAYLNLGSAHRANRAWAKAETAYNNATRLQPSYPEAYFNLGLLYLDADPYPGLDTVTRLKKAIAFFNKYRQLAGAAGTAAAATSEPGDDIARVAKKGSQGKKSSKGGGEAVLNSGPMLDYRVVEPGKERFSTSQADLYIEIAQKGLERERKRAEREQKRKTAKTEDAAKTTEADEGGAAGGPNSGEPGAASSDKSEKTGSSATQAKSPVTPKASQPKASQPKAKQPEAKQPEAKQPEAKKPEAKKPEAKKPEAKKPEAKKPEAKKPEAKKPEAKKPTQKPQKPAQKPAQRPGGAQKPPAAQKPGRAGNQ